MARAARACYHLRVMGMFRSFPVVALATTLCLPVAASAAPECQCRANGKTFAQGETACLAMPDGPRLARCEMVLNNSSWKVLDRPCVETARLPEKLSYPTATRLSAATSGK